LRRLRLGRSRDGFTLAPPEICLATEGVAELGPGSAPAVHGAALLSRADAVAVVDAAAACFLSADDAVLLGGVVGGDTFQRAVLDAGAGRDAAEGEGDDEADGSPHFAGFVLALDLTCGEGCVGRPRLWWAND
jgi:hypothetical protein